MTSHEESHASDADAGEAGAAHPAPDDLERYADGGVDAGRDASLVRHVASCAECRDEIERIRRAAASLALSSAPPPDLFARIRARRAAGERVQLPVDDPVAPLDSSSDHDVTAGRERHPALIDVHRVADGEVDADVDASLIAHVRGCATCRREMEDARRITAALSLTSRAPGDLSERIGARRASGERVLLPVDPSAASSARSTHGDASHPTITTARDTSAMRGRAAWRTSRWTGGLAIAATLLLAAGVGREAWKRGQPSVANEPVAGGDSSSRAPSSGATAPAPPTHAPPSTARGAPADSAIVPLPTSTAFRGASDSAERLWLALDPDARRARWRETTTALERLHAERPVLGAPRAAAESLAIALGDAAFDGAALTSGARDAARALAAILARRPEYRVTIVARDASVPPDSARDRLTPRSSVVRDALVSGGVSAERITIAARPEPGPARRDSSGVDVIVLAPKRAPEIR